MAPDVQTHLLVSIWMDLLTYGLYVPFFLAAAYILVSKPTQSRIPSLVFLLTNIAIFIILTVHIGVNCYRLVRAYGYVVAGTPIAYIQNAASWDNWAHTVLICLIPWFGNALFVYRLWLVWEGNYYVTILPFLLWLFNTGFSAALLHWFKTFFTSYANIEKWLDASYPLAFTENLVVTVLIAYKTWQQQRADIAAGVRTSTGFTFFMRVFWDSAALYTIETLIMIPLYFEMHPGQFVLQAGMLNSVGIIAAIMAIRVHFSHSKTVLADATDDVPAWLNEKASTHSKTSSKAHLQV